jgi:guanine deaminase
MERGRPGSSGGEEGPVHIVTGHVLTPVDGSPGEVLDLERGAVAMRGGRILAVGGAEEVLARHPGGSVESHGERLVVPGFVDCHVHYSQLSMIASPGLELLEWLRDYTFPAEARFADPAHCAEAADFFTEQLILHGVTTACVYPTVHPGSAHALFRSARAKGLRLITGKVCMDRNAPEPLLDTPERAYEQSLELLEAWHGRGRLEYALTPRFAPTSSPRQLELLGRLAEEHPDVVIQTHLAESLPECGWVGELFPSAGDYTAVYERYGLVRERSVFGHALHLSEGELDRLAAARASLVHCPTSNLFLGSGLFEFERLRRRGLRIGLGSDVGAGTSLSPLASLNEAYKVSRMVGEPMDPFGALRLATLGGAEALGRADRVGSLEAGKDADLVVLDPWATPVLGRRAECAESMAELLFALTMLGDDRSVRAVYVAGAQMKEPA